LNKNATEMLQCYVPLFITDSVFNIMQIVRTNYVFLAGERQHVTVKFTCSEYLRGSLLYRSNYGTARLSGSHVRLVVSV